MKISIIGAGIGGLTTACLLSNKGHDVTVYEKNSDVGGKMDVYEEGGFKFDTGPHVLTMPFVFNDFFKRLNLKESDYLEYILVDPINKFIWSDGHIFEPSTDLHKTYESILKLGCKKNAYEFHKYLKYSEKLYNYSLENFLTSTPSKSLNFKNILKNLEFLKLEPWRNLKSKNSSMISNKYIRETLDLYGLYSGSDPRKVSSVFNVISHIQFAQGLRYVKGGLYNVALAMEKICLSQGVKFVFNKKVENIKDLDRIVISNADSLYTLEKFLGKKITKRNDYSTSAFILLLGLDKKYPTLSHHNNLMSDDPKSELDDVFNKKVPAKNPTIGIDVQTRSEFTRAPDNGECLFVMVNPPGNVNGYNWEDKKHEYAKMIIERIKAFEGISDIDRHVVMQKIITPDDIATKYNQPYGSIYGLSSNGTFASFTRPQNKISDNFYLVGGSTHPGGGVPMCMLSGMIVSDMITASQRQKGL